MLINKNESNFEQAPEGTFIATVIGVEVKENDIFKDFSTGEDIQRTSITVEFGFRDENNKPFKMKRKFKASLHEKSTFTQVIKAACGKITTPFDTDSLKAKKVQVTVEHRDYNGKVYANIVNISPIAKAVTKPTAAVYNEEPTEAPF